MNIKENYRKISKETKNFAYATMLTGAIISPFAIIASAITAPFRNIAGEIIYGAYLPIKAGVEYAQNKTEEKFEGKLKNVGLVYGLGTHSKIRFAEFELQDGSTKKIYDLPRILEGKLASNQILPKQSGEHNWTNNLSFTSIVSESFVEGKNLEIGKNYIITSIDDVVLDVK